MASVLMALYGKKRSLAFLRPSRTVKGTDVSGHLGGDGLSLLHRIRI